MAGCAQIFGQAQPFNKILPTAPTVSIKCNKASDLFPLSALVSQDFMLLSQRSKARRMPRHSSTWITSHLPSNRWFVGAENTWWRHRAQRSGATETSSVQGCNVEGLSMEGSSASSLTGRTKAIRRSFSICERPPLSVRPQSKNDWPFEARLPRRQAGPEAREYLLGLGGGLD